MVHSRNNTKFGQQYISKIADKIQRISSANCMLFQTPLLHKYLSHKVVFTVVYFNQHFKPKSNFLYTDIDFFSIWGVSKSFLIAINSSFPIFIMNVSLYMSLIKASLAISTFNEVNNRWEKTSIHNNCIVLENLR